MIKHVLTPNRQNALNLEINTTKTCNFRCTYCYEQDMDNHDIVFKDTDPEFDFDELVSFIDRIKDSQFLKERYDGLLKICFWGGEPFLRHKLIKRLITYYLNDEQVSFFSYTNGSFIKELFDILELVNYDRDKFSFQISYDGHEVHKKNRKTLADEETVYMVYKNILEVQRNFDQSISLKPTIPMGEDFQLLVSAYKDYIKLYYYMKDVMKVDVSNFYFKPTPSGAHKPSSKDSVLENKEMYYNTLEEVAKIEQLFLKAEGRHFFDWFRPVVSICGAGRGLITLDRDYKIYTCHNFLYYEEDQIKGHVLFDKERDNDDLEVLFKNLSMFSNCSLCKEQKPTQKCKDCDVHYCIRCNTAVFASSERADFLERWTDYGAQNDICELWKINHEIYDKYFK